MLAYRKIGRKNFKKEPTCAPLEGEGHQLKKNWHGEKWGCTRVLTGEKMLKEVVGTSQGKAICGWGRQVGGQETIRQRECKSR